MNKVLQKLDPDDAQVEYNPKEFLNQEGHLDFSKAHMYDEELVRYNINQVKRKNSTIVAEPTAVKEVVVVEKPNFVKVNKECGRTVQNINAKRYESIKNAD